MPQELLFALGSSVLALIAGGVLIRNVLSKPTGDAKMNAIASAIQEGAAAYLNRQYRTIAIVAVIVAVLIAWKLNKETAYAFLTGAVLSALAGYIGMNVSVRANVRTAQAAKTGMAAALSVAVQGGLVTGLSLWAWDCWVLPGFMLSRITFNISSVLHLAEV